MSESLMYHEGNRRLQDRFDSRRISDRLEEKLTRTAFTPDDKGRASYYTSFVWLVIMGTRWVEPRQPGLPLAIV